MTARLTDKIIIVTGAASGIGRGTALRLLEEGALVAAVDLREEDLAALMEIVPVDARSRLFVHRVDIADEESVRTAVADVVTQFGRLDAIVNAAGILYGDHTHEMTLDRWNRLIQVNLTGTFLMVRESLPHLLATTSGVIINFASTSAFFAHPYMAAYAATKGANGGYGPLATWRVGADGFLVGRLEMPMAIGTVGGTLRVHPGARLSLRILGTKDAAEVGMIMAAVGMASNLAALRAMAAEGIQRGHMSMHARTVALGVGATGELVDAVAKELARLGDVRPERAIAILAQLQAEQSNGAAHTASHFERA